MKYSIYDPTGNITALIEGPLNIEDAVKLMDEHPEVEQAGFVRKAEESEDGIDAVLEMSGGEFCGNASMCAAVWHAENKGMASGTVRLRVSGARDLVEVVLKQNGTEGFKADVSMPKALEICDRKLTFDGVSDVLPMVRWEGLTHMIIEEGTVFSDLLKDGKKAEAAVKNWCTELSVKGLGLMFVKGAGEKLKMTPLVYIPGSDTLFWEHSCASGSSAVCMYYAQREAKAISLELVQPGGKLTVKSGPGCVTWLSGNVKLLSAD